MNITIVGGGFGGVKTALELSKDPQNKITLITDKPDFQYYPALYGTATGKSHLQAWVPLGEIFANIENVIVRLDTITEIDPEQRILSSASGMVYSYETCVLALGAVTTYFGIEGLETFAYGIKSADEIKRLKQRIYSDIVERHMIDKHYVIVGGGPTGVELASSLGLYIQRLAKHHGLRQHKVQVDLVEASPRLLPRMTEMTSAKVLGRLKKAGVHVQTGKAVQSATADQLMVSGKPIKSHTVIWTSGVANHPFYKANAAHFTLAPNGRVVVDEHMMAMKHVYVIGDNAATQFTGLAQTALRDALFVSKNIQRQQQHLPLVAYKAIMPPVIVPVGDNWAVFEWGKLRMSGWPASLIRRAADFIGYSDMLPFGQALGTWRSQKIVEDTYFAPVVIEETL